MKHVCRICGQEKDVTEFRKELSHGPYELWNLRECKACVHVKYLKKYNDPAQRATQLQASRNWKQNHKEQHAELAREYRKRHPEKTIAQNKLNYAIKKGKIERRPCEVCGTDQRIHAHHKSYDPKDWYNVRWLCYVCHKSLERKQGEV